MDPSHLSCLDYESQLLYTDTGKKQALEGHSAPQNTDGISLGYGTEAKIWECWNRRGCWDQKPEIKEGFISNLAKSSKKLILQLNLLSIKQFI